MSAGAVVDSARDRGLQDYRKKLLEHKEVESRLKESKFIRKCKVKFFCQIIAEISDPVFIVITNE